MAVLVLGLRFGLSLMTRTPQTLNPKPQTLNPKPQTLNLSFIYTLNVKELLGKVAVLLGKVAVLLGKVAVLLGKVSWVKNIDLAQ